MSRLRLGFVDRPPQHAHSCPCIPPERRVFQHFRQAGKDHAPAAPRACLVCSTSIQARGLLRRLCGLRQHRSGRGSAEQHDPMGFQAARSGDAGRAGRSAISPGDGGRPPGGRHGNSGVSIRSARVRPMLASIWSEQLPLGSGERMAAAIFLAARRFADDQGRAGWVALGEHQIAGGVAQGASVELGQGRTQFVQRRRPAPPRPKPVRPGALLRLGHASSPGRRAAGLASSWPQAVDGVEVYRLVGTPFDLQPQQMRARHPSRAARKRSRSTWGTRFFFPSCVAGPSVTRSRMKVRPPPLADQPAAFGHIGLGVDHVHNGKPQPAAMTSRRTPKPVWLSWLPVSP